MVCKEDILLWFKESPSYKRLDVICNLLNMCVPFELRFVGTCIEEIGKHCYQELRGAESRANNHTELSLEVNSANSGLSDRRYRRKLTLYLSLLRSCNYTCAKDVFDILTRTNIGEIIAKDGASVSEDGSVLDELLLLYTMAIHHPAFTFEQRTCFGKILMQLLEEEKTIHSPPAPYPIPIQRVPIPKTYTMFVKSPIQDDGPVPIPGPPPGIPLASAMREPMMGPGPWCAPHKPPSPHVQESPVHSRTASPISSPQNVLPIIPRPTRRPPFLSRQELTNRKIVDNAEEKLVPEGENIPVIVNNTWRNSRNQNGIRMSRINVQPVSCNQQHLYCTAQLEALNLDPETTRHCSSSSESGRSSTSHSPPGTPHAPGRRKSDTTRPRVNGRPSHNVIALPLPTAAQTPCADVTATTMPPPIFPQNSVPYSAPYSFPTNRTAMFTYPAQNYRPPFTYQPNSELVYPYPAPFVQVMAYPSQIPPPKITCWNCGATGHTGHDCPEPSMEEVTRPGNYQLDYTTSPPPDCTTDK